MSRAEQDQMASTFFFQWKKKGLASRKGGHQLSIRWQNVSLGCVSGPIKQQVRLVQVFRRLENEIDVLRTIRPAIEL
jgi:hypothetical protein